MRGRLSAFVALGIALLASAVGCHKPEGAGTPADGKAEIEALRAELAKARAEAEASRAELEQTRAEIDLKWARQVAEHFLTALAREDKDEVRSVCTKEYAARFPGYQFAGTSPNRANLSIDSHLVSPDRLRVTFRGPISLR